MAHLDNVGYLVEASVHYGISKLEERDRNRERERERERERVQSRSLHAIKNDVVGCEKQMGKQPRNGQV